MVPSVSVLTGFDCNEESPYQAGVRLTLEISIKFLLVISLFVKQSGHENYGHDHTR